MVDGRKFSRKRHEIKLTQREAGEKQLMSLMIDALREIDPTAHSGAVRVISELAAVIVSQLLAETQAGQRALAKIENEIADYGTAFASQLMIEARKDVGRRILGFHVLTSISSENNVTLRLADDWAGPVAGPTLIETHFGIPRSTLYRWQKRNEVIAINSRTSRKPVFPLKQFVDGRPAPGIPEIIAIFGDQRVAWSWLLTACSAFQNQPPLNALLKGEVLTVTETAKSVVLHRGNGLNYSSTEPG